MAILIDFQKVREDSREVEYQFGLIDRMDRHLVIDKESQEGRPVDGNPDGHYHRVLSAILRYVRSGKTWPDKGSYAA